jgi:galactokinase
VLTRGFGSRKGYGPDRGLKAIHASVQSAARELYRQSFGTWPAHTAAAPGRVELLGYPGVAHQGPVLAATIDRHVEAAISSRTDGRVEVAVTRANQREGFLA